MNNVFLKTRELGQALLESTEYRNLRDAEAVAMKNAEAAEAMGLYMEKKQEIQNLLAGETPDTEALKRLSDEMDAYQSKLQGNPDVQKLTEARRVFSELIDQVNQVLRFIVTGETAEGDTEEEGGCGGSCASCGGGCHHLH